MMTAHSFQPTDWREARRFRAVDLRAKGWSQTRIAEALGVTQGAVSQWLRRAQAEGVPALRRRKAPGATPRLTAEQRAELPRLLARGAEAFGFRGDVWTQPRVVALIRRVFGVTYHPSHVGRLLRACGWSSQKPARRARQRDEEAIRRWAREHWPVLKKGRSGRGGPSSG